ncbi:MAG TPA: ATP-binding protein [Bryobacteraceae bacterium]|nr:ATP-binding protein [Bryobacteraceae bacterium]
MADNPIGLGPRVERSLESTLESVDVAETLVLEVARDSGFGEDDEHRVGMAVREAMVNAVVHGNRYNLKKKVHLRVGYSEGRLSVVIRDEGEGFEATDLPDPLAEENLLRQSGRGLLLIKAFVSEFDMRKADPSGTELTMKFDKVQGN